MSSVHGSDAGAGPSRSSTPTRGQGSSLSASLAAHLTKPVAPTATTLQTTATTTTTTMPNVSASAAPGHTHASSDGSHAPWVPGASAFHHNGKASAVTAGPMTIAEGDLWKSAAARRAEKAWAAQSEKVLYQSDVRFKKYVLSIDKVLASFENVSEWADFIAFLSRLIKALQAYPQYNAIPRKLIVAKRLSQCLNPALPSGVHQRALEVYDHIFTVITEEGLRRDLAIWSPGLLPFIPFASTTVKPLVLGILERYYLPLGPDLRLVIKPLQLALLPGLEEEASEYFERSLKLLDKIVACLGLDCFLQVLWLQMININAVRLAALQFLARRLPPIHGSEKGAAELTAVIGPDFGLMVRAFAASLDDSSSLLVQRAMLDILVSHLKIDSAFTTFVRREDRVLLVRSALSVVLRRDLSLNRRLYVWLLGSSEEQDVQLKFFQQHSLAYTQAAMMIDLSVDAEVKSTANPAERQRTIRILISLLDKWSIGLPLTNAMIVDVFKALKHDMTSAAKESSNSRAGAPDISTTAKMLFEAVDPFAMFRQFFYAIQKECRADASVRLRRQILSLLRFVFSSFRVHDEESRVVHLPTLLAALVELSTECPDQAWKLVAMQLAREILMLIPKRVFASRSYDSAVKSETFEKHASLLYQDKASSSDAAAKSYVGFQHPRSVGALLDTCITHFSAGIDRQVIVEASSVLCALFAVLDASASRESFADDSEHVDTIDWDTRNCQERILALIPSAETFAEVEAYFEALFASQRCRTLKNKVGQWDNRVTHLMAETLFSYMTRTATPYHVRAVDLFWTLADTGSSVLAPVLCRRITTGNVQDLEDGLDIFDVLWKHSDDARLSHPILREPLLCILEGLRSSVWDERQLIEAWVRNNPRNFTALLDPLLDWTDDSTFVHTSVSSTVDSVAIEHFLFRQKPDIRLIVDRLTLLLQLARIGSANFGRAMRSNMPPQAARKREDNEAPSQSTYGQVISDALGLFLSADLPDDFDDVSDLHASSAELLHAVISKMNVGERVSESIQKALLERLLLDINAERLQAQSKILQALHGMMILQAAAASSAPPAPPPLLLPTLKAGLTQPGNRRILQHWTEFVLAMTPIYKGALSNLLMPLNQGLCALVRTSLEDLEDAYDAGATDVVSSTTESELLALLTMSERVLLQSLDFHGDTKPVEPPSSGFSEKVDPFGFMGALSNVFTADTGATGDDQPSSSAIWKSLHHTVRTLHLVWLISTPSEEVSRLAANKLPDSRVDTLTYVKSRVQSRCRRYFEKLYRNHSGEVVEALIACWKASTAAGDVQGSQCTFEVLGQLAPSAQIVVTFLCDVISTRMTPVPAVEKTSRNSAIPVVSNGVLFAFLEAYLARLDATATLQVWPVVIMLIKDILSTSAQHKAQIYPSLRCLTVTAERIADSAKGDDRRVRRELLDSYVRLCDLAVLIAGRSFESTSWIGRRTQAADTLVADEKESSLSNPMSASLTDVSGGSSQLVEAIQLYLGKNALPALRKFAAEPDKVTSLCSNIVYYIIANALRQRKKGIPDVSSANVHLTYELTRHSGTIKYWRAPVADLFTDVKFFHQDALAGREWMPVIHALMSSDKERFVETIGRVATPSTNIFTNREAETALRAIHVRRLTYAIYSAPKDFWLPQLPLIQEKLVDLFRNSTTDPVVCEAYLCMRVLLVRFASQHLGFLWPVVVTEMIRLFEDCLEELPADDSDKLMLAFAASKFLDLLITLQIDEFQIYQWLFITDTSDIVYPPDDWASESLLDRLALAIEEKRGSQHRFVGGRARPSSVKSLRRVRLQGSRDSMRSDYTGQQSVPATEHAAEQHHLLHSTTKQRQPYLLHHIGMHIHAMEDLQPYFANASLHAYESSYGSGHDVDLDAIESMLLADMFPRVGATETDNLAKTDKSAT